MKKLLVILLVLGLAAPAMAAEWNFFGSARMATFWTDFDPEDLEDLGVGDDEGLQHFLQGNSRIGANVKVNDQIGGAFEYGAGGGNASIRKLYGTYNFGSGSLLVGQTYTPTSNYFYSNSVFGEDGDLLGRGQFYAGRRAMVQLTIDGFKFALVSPTAGTDELGGFTDVDVSLPKFEASYNLKSDVFFIDVFAGYQTYELEDADEDTVDVDAYTIGVGGGVMFGPVTLSAAVNMGQNYASYGATTATYGAIDRDDIIGLYGPVLDGDDTEDSDALQAMFVANFKVSDTLAFEAGVGYAQYENDAFDDASLEEWQYYANAVITIAPGFFVVPEVGMINLQGDDLGIDAEDLGEVTYLGLKWQINF